jgi:hypothetical protein
MTNVSFDSEETAAAIAQWRDYAEQVENHGASNPALLAHLRNALGDTYADFTDAKVLEQQERTAAYRRVAAQARSHADKLANTRTNFDAADAENKANFDAIKPA